MRGKQKIIIAAEIFPPDVGGPATYARALAERLVSMGYLVSVLTYGETSKQGARSKEQGARYKLRKTSRSLPLLIRYLIYFWKLLWLTLGARVIYAQGPVSAGLPCSWIKKIMPWKKVILRFPGDQAWERMRLQGGREGFMSFMGHYERNDIADLPEVSRALMNIQRRSLQTVDTIVIPGHWMKDLIVKAFQVKPERVITFPSGVSRRQKRLKRDGFESKTLLFIARLTNWKGLDTFSQALLNLPEFNAVVVGEGPELKSAQGTVKETNLSNRVRFAGKVSHEQVKDFFSHSFAYVLPSRYEGKSHLILEAWSFGTPVVVSDFPANIELVQDGKTGLVFRLGDSMDLAQKIRLLASDKALYTKLAQSGFEEHRKYSADKIMNQTIEFLVA